MEGWAHNSFILEQDTRKAAAGWLGAEVLFCSIAWYSYRGRGGGAGARCSSAAWWRMSQIIIQRFCDSFPLTVFISNKRQRAPGPHHHHHHPQHTIHHLYKYYWECPVNLCRYAHIQCPLQCWARATLIMLPSATPAPGTRHTAPDTSDL